MQPSQNCINLIKEFEGFRANAYLCPAGIVTIGYGTTIYSNGEKVQKGDTITRQRAEEELTIAVTMFAREVNRLITVPVTQGQFDAIVSFAYNCGLGALKNSTLLRKLNLKDYSGASNEFLKWTKGGGETLPGLVRRRDVERKMFLQSPPNENIDKATWFLIGHEEEIIYIRAMTPSSEVVETLHLKNKSVAWLIDWLRKFPEARTIIHQK